MHRIRALGRPWLLACALAAPAAAQLPPGPAPPRDCSALDGTAAPGSPAFASMGLARDAIGRGDAAAAVTHLLVALAALPDQPGVLADIARTVPDPGARAYWIERLVRASADGQGRFELEPRLRTVFTAPELAAARQLAQLRAAAAAELGKMLDRTKPAGAGGLGNGAIARWLVSLFVDLCSDAPQLLRAHGAAVATGAAPRPPEWELVCKALLQVALGKIAAPATAAGDADAARRQRLDLQLRAARLLRGLVRQAGFGKDIQGVPPPDLSAFAGPAAAAENAVAAALGAPRVFSIAELEALDAAARVAFTLAHRSWADPGVALSPTAKYRIETTCGCETLLGVAKTIELHHQRLVAHYGVDPFAGRQGTIVIVPQQAEFESEGQPFWWAGGFQAGDRTVVRSAWNSIPLLGHTLTHELTHRFDGVLRPFQRPWYGEGHASWTAGHYAAAADADFVDDHLVDGTCAHTYWKGYADMTKLSKLLTGELEDYRDNYFAGYSLYAYLRGYPPGGPPRFRAALAKFEAGARGGQKDPVGWFTKVFCDGKEGRPADFAAFVAQWRDFLAGCAGWQDPRTKDATNAWVGHYGRLGGADPAPLLPDEPTWSWDHQRFEPYFGQGQAGPSGDVLAEAGMREAAAAAYLWSLQCDGWQDRVALAAVTALAALGRADAAGALLLLARQRFPAECAALAVPPMQLHLPRLLAYVDALAAAAQALPPAQAVAAAAFAREAARLRALLPAGHDVAAAAEVATAAPPSLPRALGVFGWVEDKLAGYDDERVANLWYATPSGDLHVGREQPRTATGEFDRAAQARDAFVHSVEWLPPGEHVVRASIHFTTSFVAGAVIVGHSRRDRGVRVAFSAGDPDYAIGRTEAEPTFERVDVAVQGMWERDEQMPESRMARSVRFTERKPSFDLELRIRGPQLIAIVDGVERLRYAMPDGAPIEGYVGFASSRGAYRVQQPTVQCVDRGAQVGLDIAVQPTEPVDELEGRPTRGLPRGPVGTLVLWLPPPQGAEGLGAELPRALPVLAKMLRDAVEFPQPWVLAVPAGSDAATVAAIQQQVREVRGDVLPLVEHHVAAPMLGGIWVLFVDAAGVLRAAAQVGDPRLHAAVQRWAQQFRAR